MKKTSFLYGALGLMTLGLAACTSDMPEITNNGVAQNDEVRYLRVAIANPPSSRAAEFVNGTDAENQVNNMYFQFYDAAGNPINGETTLLDIPDSGEIPFDPVTPANGNVGKVREAVVQLSLQRGAAYPSYVVCFINPVDYAELGNATTMASLHSQKRSSYMASSTSGFAMNNSVYYGADKVSGASNVRIFGTPILAENLKNSLAEASSDENTDIVNIYVERYAAKVNFTLATENITPITDVTGYTLTFVPEAWSINADAPEMFAAKRFDRTATESEDIPTYAQVNTMLGTWTTWNDADNFRCYWACSPSYYATEFPQVSDDIIDKVEGDGTGAGQIVGNYALKYYSYDQIMNGTGAAAGVKTFNGSTKYTMENTMGAAAFNSLNPKAAAPSVVLVGHYDLTPTGATAALPVTDGFCLYGGQVFFRGSVPAGAPTGSTTMLRKFVAENEILAVDGTGTLLKTNNMTPFTSVLEVAHPGADVRGTQPIPHRYVTLQLKSVPATPLYFKPAGSDTWVAVTADNLTYVNTLLWQQLGNASSYTQNKCYYSIPIQHVGFYENTAGQPVNDQGAIEWANVRVGDFGLVRNHVYNINVTGITGRANGIENLENPLVPSMDDTNYWIKYTVNILNWRVVPTQDVTL